MNVSFALYLIAGDIRTNRQYNKSKTKKIHVKVYQYAKLLKSLTRKIIQNLSDSNIVIYIENVFRNKIYILYTIAHLNNSNKVYGNFVLLTEVLLIHLCSFSLLNERSLSFRFESKHQWLITESRIVASPHSMYRERQFF